MDEREKLQERYDDAAFALMMDECAEADGEVFLAEFRAAAEAGDLPEIPADMDRLFRDTIKREFAARERKVRFRQFKRAAARVAIAVFAVIGILGTLVMSVEAWRVAFLNQLIEYRDKYAVINYSSSEGDSHSIDAENDPIIGILPEVFVTEYYYVVDSLITSGYSTPQGNSFMFDMSPADAEFRFDTEGADCEYVTINGQEILLINKDGLRAVWLNMDKTIIFSTVSTGISRESFVDIITRIIQLFH